MDLLVAGLGNPGPEHARDRHNVGWMVVDELARRHQGAFKGKFRGRLADVRVDGSRVALLKPETYMNESGSSIQAAAAFYKLPPEQIVVVHDDVDLETARLQARLGGGLAGHNGLRSIAAAARDAGLSPSARRGRAARAAATGAPWPTTSSRRSRRRTTWRRSSAGRPTRSSCSQPKGSTRRSAVSTDWAGRTGARAHARLSRGRRDTSGTKA